MRAGTRKRQILCVAEKPSVAKAASQILSNNKMKSETSKSKYNPNFRFTTYFQNELVDVIFTSVAGHVYQLDFPENFRWGKTDPKNLWHAPIIEYIPDDFKNMADNIKTLAGACFCVELWLDNDREGEEISEEVEKLCLAGNKQIAVYRARFSALSSSEVKNAFYHPTTINRRDAAAVKLRQELDLRIGAAFTRFLSRWKGKLNSADVISFGTCQFPTLGFVVDAWKKHEEHKPENYWYLEAIVKVGPQSVTLKWDRNHLFCKLSCSAIFIATAQRLTCRVTNVFEKPVTKEKPLPLSTIELQKRGSKWLKLPSSQVMKIAEELYQGGYISYPRTETDAFPADFDFQSVVDAMKISNTDIGLYANKISTNIVPPRKGSHSDNAHPPIYPLKIFESSRSASQRKVFELIARHFLACCSKDAYGMETFVQFDINGEKFHVKGLRIVERNWLEVYPYVKWEGTVLPEFHENTFVDLNSFKMKEDSTKPPPLLTEPELLTKMNKEGIGTDATFQEHIQKIQDRKYCYVSGNYFYPTHLGVALVNAYESMGFDFAKPKLRAELEKSLQGICQGQEDPNATKTRYINSYEDAYIKSEQMSSYIDRSVAEQERIYQQNPNQPLAGPSAARRPSTHGTPDRSRNSTNQDSDD